jgi:hypothetical protein
MQSEKNMQKMMCRFKCEDVSEKWHQQRQRWTTNHCNGCNVRFFVAVAAGVFVV